jgi:hypothetical protein
MQTAAEIAQTPAAPAQPAQRIKRSLVTLLLLGVLLIGVVCVVSGTPYLSAASGAALNAAMAPQHTMSSSMPGYSSAGMPPQDLPNLLAAPAQSVEGVSFPTSSLDLESYRQEVAMLAQQAGPPQLGDRVRVMRLNSPWFQEMGTVVSTGLGQHIAVAFSKYSSAGVPNPAGFWADELIVTPGTMPSPSQELPQPLMTMQ